MKEVKGKKNKSNYKMLLKENKYYLVAILVVFVITTISVICVNNSLNSEEKLIYNVVSKNKEMFKNPESLKIVSAKVCNENYLMIRITANNSYGAETTETYYVNKHTLTDDDLVSKVVVEKCFKEELNNYDDVKVLSNISIKKLNKKL